MRTVGKADLSAGQVDPHNSDAAVEKALRVLNAASQTRSGLAQKLKRAGFSPVATEAACVRVEAMGYVDDRAFAQALLGKRQRQGRGVRVIASELRHKGLDPDLVDDVVGEVDAEEELRRAVELAERLWQRREDEPLVRRREHVAGALLRRGYPTWVVRKAVERAAEGEQRSPG